MSETMIFDRWIRSRRDWVLFGLTIASFAVLDLLAIFGYEAALHLLVILTGTLLGVLLSALISIPLRQTLSSLPPTPRRVTAFGLGFASLGAIMLVGSYIFGLPVFPSEGSDILGGLVFGIAIGLGSGLWRRLSLSPPATPEETREASKAQLRLALMIAGTVVGLFALTFGAYFVIEYVLSPLARYFAS